MQLAIWVLRFAAALCLVLVFGEWLPTWSSPRSLAGSFLLLLAVAIYVWLAVFPRKWQEEAIGSAIGLVLGAHLIYLTNLSIILLLVKPVPLFHGANLFLLAVAILTWIANARTFNPVRVVGAALIPSALWAFLIFVLPSLV